MKKISILCMALIMTMSAASVRTACAQTTASNVSTVRGNITKVDIIARAVVLTITEGPAAGKVKTLDVVAGTKIEKSNKINLNLMSIKVGDEASITYKTVKVLDRQTNAMKDAFQTVKITVLSSSAAPAGVSTNATPSAPARNFVPLGADATLAPMKTNNLEPMKPMTFPSNPSN